MKTLKKFNDFLTFSRNSTGTRINPNGLLESVPANQQRFDYDPITNQPLGQIFEFSATNFENESTNFISNGWNVNATTRANNIETFIDGTQTADEVTVASDGTFRDIRKTYSVFTPGSLYTVSVFYKAGSLSNLALQIDNAPTIRVRFDLSTQETFVEANEPDIYYHNIEDYGNGWYRCYISFYANNSSALVRLQARNAVAGDTYYVCGMQVEQGNLSSYIPTDGTSLSRSSDLCTIQDVDFLPGNYGTIVADIELPKNYFKETANRSIFEFKVGSDYFNVRTRSNAGDFLVQVRTNNINYIRSFSNLAEIQSFGLRLKVAITFDAVNNRYAFTYNGKEEILSRDDVIYPEDTYDRFGVAIDPNFNSLLPCRYRSFTYKKDIEPDSELPGLSTII
jgi:hypothetical protein